MNKFSFIFIFFLCAYLFPGHFSGRECISNTKQSSELGIHEKSIKGKKNNFYLSDFDTSEKRPDSSKKKKRIKGIESKFCCLPDEFFFHTNVIEIELIFSLQKVYFFRLFSINEKRGPPQLV